LGYHALVIYWVLSDILKGSRLIHFETWGSTLIIDLLSGILAHMCIMGEVFLSREITVTYFWCMLAA